MRIALAAPLYPPEPGGPATYAKLLFEEFPAQGIDVVLVKFSSVRHLPKVLRHIAYTYAVWSVARTCDLVYVLDPVSTGLPAYLGALCAGKPLYLRTAGDYAWEQGTQRYGVTDLLDDFVVKNTYPFPVQVIKAVQTFVAHRAKHIVVPSAYFKRVIMAWGIPSEKISVVYNAPARIDETAIRSRPTVVSGPYIATVARLVPWKGVASIIRALKILHDEGETLSFVVIGSGPEEERLRTLTKECGLADSVIFTGPLTHGSSPGYVAHADAFVLNTRYEGFSHVILEAFAVGTPVLTTPIGGNPEQVEDGVTGLMFPVDDEHAIATAIRKIRSDSVLRTGIIARAREKVATFTHDRVLNDTRTALTTHI